MLAVEPYEQAAAAEIEEKLKVPHLIARILTIRGARSAHEAARFLHPTIEHLSDPALLPDVKAGVAAVIDAVTSGKKIGVFVRDLLEEHGVELDEDMRKRLCDRIALVNLPQDILGKFPVELSGGMKQRILMVIATLLNPQLLVADEITSALDVTSQRYVADMIADFRDKHIVTSVVFITHDLAILNEIADRIMVLYAGKVAEIAPTETIIRRPRHPYTQALVKSLPRPGMRYGMQMLEGIPGTPPALIGIAEGCRFAERCPYATERCRAETPLAEECGPGHSLACWNWKTVDEVQK